jgi:hypothetical protein
MYIYFNVFQTFLVGVMILTSKIEDNIIKMTRKILLFMILLKVILGFAFILFV